MQVRRAGRGSISVAIAGLITAGAVVFKVQAQQPGPSVAAPAAASGLPHAALVEEYCISCHDEDKKKGELSFELIAEDDVARHPDVWEKVIRKLRARQMPPVGKSRPD